MKKYITAVLLWNTLLVIAQTSHIGKQSHAIDRIVSKYHYQPKPLDDSLSAYLFDHFIATIDGGGYYFLKEDMDYLSRYRYELDDQIEAKTAKFFDETAAIFEKRLTSVDSLIRVIESTPFDFRKKEVISYRDEDFPDYVNSLEALQERWRKYLKSAVLEEVFEGFYFDEPTEQSVDELLSVVDEAREKVLKAERFEIKSYLLHPSGYKTYLATFYLDDLASYYDPHTTYFSGVEKQHFEADLSKDNLAYGFSLSEDPQGVIKIESVMPGSAAWLSNSINKGDVLIEIRFADGKMVNVSQLEMDELSLIFDNDNSDELTLKLKKANGKIEEVHLSKAEIYVDEDVIKSVILDGDKKVGYITLPDFYTDWEEITGLGCANDVAKNIVKLKQERIDGLIIDLRNNGGGSLKEAIDLAGIFINYGPITIQQGKSREPKSIKDQNKGAIYTGPLAIMVNGLSASASEIFSAAMQDYNRALIVGSQTYGKSTGQVVLPLDPNGNPFLNDSEEVDASYGFLKITRSKFYRITKTTHQKEGVVPDVALRDYYELYDYKEASNPTALEKDEVDKKVYYTPGNSFPLAQLQSQSGSRLKENAYYQKICTVIDTLQKIDVKNDQVPLDIDSYLAHEITLKELFDQLFSEDDYSSEHFKVTNNIYDLEIMKINAYRSKLNEEYLENIKKDVYIGETYSVLIDYINSNQ
ncbi:MAG: carboxy terminal-processing peptidase [Crocinitomicaceae bacterium]